MFYSQFILAKKGPLGTIWIAAHLERKLRKNQVADTDIGVSVDSIIFPEVPIALRLSSHLLLGVVRIYNRKVNYLFDDCSETLLKIKQAYRSKAVDLPPEESKAPYHSITLPETFDLDDFELPDNDILHGNYVDHHISSKEQITLQDTIDGGGYSTSKFGLDERFGDGDTSGLDLDEELFLNKIGTSEHADESADPQASVGSMTPFKEHELPVDRTVNSDTMVDSANEYTDLMEYAQAPSTPGLVEEPNISNVKEASANDDHLESDDHLTEANAKHITCEDKQEVDWLSHDNTNSNAVQESGGSQIKESNPQEESRDVSTQVHESTSEILLSQVAAVNPISELAEKIIDGEDLTNGGVEKDMTDPLAVDQAPTGIDWGKSAFEISGSENEVGSFQKNPETQASREPDQEKEGSIEAQFLRPCNMTSSGNGRPTDAELQSDNADLAPCGREDADLATCGREDADLATCGREDADLATCGREDADLATCGREDAESLGKACYKTDNLEETLKENHVSSDPDGPLYISNLEDKLVENSNLELELPAPEKLLSVPNGPGDLHRDMLADGTPGDFEGLDEPDAGSNFLTGKKRSFTESTFTEQSMNSVESSRLVRFKRTSESVPDDDDLLSSILVGRKSSALKVKPTPPRFEVTSTKPTRSAPRTGAPKRKVLIDDTMVLHGDTIRQQLTNTEDIRRVRKKAPCSRAEISMIKKEYLEDEIFLEAIFTDMSTVLNSLHSQEYDLSKITVCQNVVPVAEPIVPSQNDENGIALEPIAEPDLSSNIEKNDASPQTVADPNLTTENDINGADLNKDNDIADNPSLNDTKEILPDESEIETGQENAENPKEIIPDESEIETGQENAEDPTIIAGDESFYFVENTFHDNAETVLFANDILDSVAMDINDERAIGINEVTEKENDNVECDFIFGEQQVGEKEDVLMDSSNLAKVGEKEDLLMDYVENPDLTEGYNPNIMDAEIPGFDPKDQDEANYSATANDTGFLNVDDDELNEEADDCADDEETPLTENSGWSSRTRAVSKYLQTLFVKEAECGNNSLSMNNLLIGKSRKEASRMFFETLVLKTRDYIHVEQRNPFDDVTIKPRTRLMKSEF